MDSLRSVPIIDPISREPYDHENHIPYSLPCCGETCAITTIHLMKVTTNRCPFCEEILPDAGWLKNKALCNMIPAREQTPFESQSRATKDEPARRIFCTNHPEREVGFVCLQDDTLLCFRCLSDNKEHASHSIEPLQLQLEVLKKELSNIKPKLRDILQQYKTAVEIVSKNITTYLEEKLNEKMLKADRFLGQVSLFHQSSVKMGGLRFSQARTFCEKVQNYNTQQEVKDFVKNADEDLQRDVLHWLDSLEHTIRKDGVIRIKEENLLNKEQEEVKEDQQGGHIMKIDKVNNKKEVNTRNDEVMKQEVDTKYILKGTPVCKLKGHTGPVTSLQVLSSGDVASGSYDQTIKIWNINTSKCSMTLRGHTAQVSCLKLLPSDHLASGSFDNTIRIWELGTGICLHAMRNSMGRVYCLGLLSSGHLVSGSEEGGIIIWDTVNGKCLRALQGSLFSRIFTIYRIQLLPSDHLASSSYSEVIKIYDTTTGVCLKTLKGHISPVCCLQLLSSGELASGSDDGEIRIWNTVTGTCLRTLKGHTGRVYYMNLLTSGELVSGSQDQTIRTWDAATGRCLRRLPDLDYPTTICCLELLPSGYLISGGGLYAQSSAFNDTSFQITIWS